MTVCEKTKKGVLRQCLHLITENANASDGQSIILELSERDNTKGLSAYILGQANSISHLLLTYKDADCAETDKGKKKKRKRPEDREAEANIRSYLEEVAFPGKKSKKRRLERGFEGILLGSTG